MILFKLSIAVLVFSVACVQSKPHNYDSTQSECTNEIAEVSGNLGNSIKTFKVVNNGVVGCIAKKAKVICTYPIFTSEIVEINGDDIKITTLTPATYYDVCKVEFYDDDAIPFHTMPGFKFKTGACTNFISEDNANLGNSIKTFKVENNNVPGCVATKVKVICTYPKFTSETVTIDASEIKIKTFTPGTEYKTCKVEFYENDETKLLHKVPTFKFKTGACNNVIAVDSEKPGNSVKRFKVGNNNVVGCRATKVKVICTFPKFTSETVVIDSDAGEIKISTFTPGTYYDVCNVEFYEDQSILLHTMLTFKFKTEACTNLISEDSGNLGNSIKTFKVENNNVEGCTAKKVKVICTYPKFTSEIVEIKGNDIKISTFTPGTNYDVCKVEFYEKDESKLLHKIPTFKFKTGACGHVIKEKEEKSEYFIKTFIVENNDVPGCIAKNVKVICTKTNLNEEVPITVDGIKLVTLKPGTSYNGCKVEFYKDDVPNLLHTMTTSLNFKTEDALSIVEKGSQVIAKWEYDGEKTIKDFTLIINGDSGNSISVPAELREYSLSEKAVCKKQYKVKITGNIDKPNESLEIGSKTALITTAPPVPSEIKLKSRTETEITFNVKLDRNDYMKCDITAVKVKCGDKEGHTPVEESSLTDVEVKVSHLKKSTEYTCNAIAYNGDLYSTDSETLKSKTNNSNIFYASNLSLGLCFLFLFSTTFRY